jgi:predicted NBD/HSP70 family sugar kinase
MAPTGAIIEGATVDELVERARQGDRDAITFIDKLPKP